MFNASSYTMKSISIELAIGPFLSCKFIPTIDIFVKRKGLRVKMNHFLIKGVNSR
jgi:hypothetical protein